MSTQLFPAEKIRNIAIIAHVDHGKTTLIDGLLKQSNTFRDNQSEMSQELIMDSNDQEKERGITITAKVTAVEHEGHRINIIDTPGHADFSGEVERTLNMADGCILVVDAQEGPMPQTKFVLSKALEHGLKPLVVVNKIDKPASRIAEVEDELSDLFLELAVDEAQLHYPVYYAIARDGKAWASIPADSSEQADLSEIFQAIIDTIPAPAVSAADAPFQMQVTALAWDSFKGKYAIGRITRGQVRTGDSLAVCKTDGTTTNAKADAIFVSKGTAKVEVPHATAGDIVQLTGVADVRIGETITERDTPEALPPIEIEPPTLKIYLGPNTSPFKGTEATFSTSRQIEERLQRELEANVGLRVEDEGIGFLVSGRGELHLSVLIESMRREGYEFEVGRPQVITKQEDGETVEPVEELIIEAPLEHGGAIQMELGKRRATLEQQATKQDSIRLTYRITARALIGLRNVLLTQTKGTVTMYSLSAGYQPLGAPLKQLRNGVLVAFETGTTTPYALQTVEQRGICFVDAGEKVYAGQIVGLNNRQDDMEINVCKAKHLTNMRSTSSDGVVQLTPPTKLSLEQSIDFIEDDELLEVTPKNLRLRKRELNHKARKRN
jgi:GTP-binding protein